MADMHRVRHLAWELPKQGWEVEVLAPNAEFQSSEYQEPGSEPLFNPEVPCHEVAPRDFWFFHLFNMRSIGWRALRPMAIAGVKLLKDHRFDLIYISTANFNLFCLGRWWGRQFNIPYVLDYHDPWVRDRVDYRTTPNRLKRWAAAVLSRWMEPHALKNAAGIVAVSPVYIEELRQRYGALNCLQTSRCEVIPFAASEVDLVATKATADTQTGSIEIVYTGAGGSIMAKSFLTICTALADVRRTDPVLFARLKIHLFGTSPYWREGDGKPLQEIANSCGLADIVREIPPRITYLKAMELVQQSDGLLILGVDDQGYMPSKLFSYLLSGKPLLACFCANSPPVDLFRHMPRLGHLMTFDPQSGVQPSGAAETMRRFLAEAARREYFERRKLIADYLAPAMAQRHVALFERICGAGCGT